MRTSRMESLEGSLTAAEPVDVDLAAVRTGGRASQRLQVGLQVVGIVGERLQIVAAQNRGGGVARGVRGDAGAGAFLHRHLLRHRRDFHFQVQGLRARLQNDL